MLNTPIISFNSTGIALGADVAMNNNSINGLTNLTASDTITINTVTTNRLTTMSSAYFNIISDSSGISSGINRKTHQVLFKGLDNEIYFDAQHGGVPFYSDVYIDTTLMVAGRFSIGAQTAIDTWNEQLGGIKNDWEYYNEWNNLSSWKHIIDGRSYGGSWNVQLDCVHRNIRTATYTYCSGCI